MEHNDFELIDLARDNNEEAIKIIYDKYKPIIIRKAKDLYGIVNHHGVEINDLIQEGYIGLDNAINGFKDEDNVTFYTFATLCIERQIITFIRRTSGNRNKLLNDAINIDNQMEHLLKDELDIEKLFISYEDYDETIILLKNSLSSFEKKVFEYKMEGYSNNEISSMTNKDMKVIYNTVNRIKNKLKNIIVNK